MFAGVGKDFIMTCGANWTFTRNTLTFDDFSFHPVLRNASGELKKFLTTSSISFRVMILILMERECF